MTNETVSFKLVLWARLLYTLLKLSQFTSAATCKIGETQVRNPGSFFPSILTVCTNMYHVCYRACDKKRGELTMQSLIPGSPSTTRLTIEAPRANHNVIYPEPGK